MWLTTERGLDLFASIIDTVRAKDKRVSLKIETAVFHGTFPPSLFFIRREEETFGLIKGSSFKKIFVSVPLYAIIGQRKREI